MSDDLAPGPKAPNPTPYGGRFGAIGNLRSLAARGMIVNSIYQLALAGLAVGRGLAAAALLSADEYGVWGLLGLAMFTVVGLKAVGVNQKYVQQSDADQELAFQRGFAIELIFASISLPAVAALVCLISVLTGHPEVIPAGLVLTLMIPGLAMQFPAWAYYRKMDFRRQRLLQGVDPLVATVVTVVLAVGGLGYWSLVVGSVVGAIAGGVAALANAPYALRLRYDRGTLRQYVGFSGPMAVAGLAVLATFYGIYLVGNEAIGLAGLGAFTLAGNLVRFTDKADAIITDTLYPALCAVQDRTETLYAAFVKSNRLALIWAAPFGIGISLFAADLVGVLGPQWEPAIPLIQILGVVTAVHHVGYNWVAFYRARGDTRPIATSSIAGALVTLGFGIPLMFAIGVTGLGWAFAIAEAAALGIRGYYLARLFDGFSPVRHVVRGLWPTAAGAAVVLTLRAAGLDGPPALELATFLLVVIAGTCAFERPLLREAIGYFSSRPGPGQAPAGASASAG